eukprot:scaffold2188_cov388-Prasinococcus_capsulatus_cf.AAC.10
MKSDSIFDIINVSDSNRTLRIYLDRTMSAPAPDSPPADYGHSRNTLARGGRGAAGNRESGRCGVRGPRPRQRCARAGDVRRAACGAARGVGRVWALYAGRRGGAHRTARRRPRGPPLGSSAPSDGSCTAAIEHSRTMLQRATHRCRERRR